MRTITITIALANAALAMTKLKTSKRLIPTSDDWHPPIRIDGADYVEVTTNLFVYSKANQVKHRKRHKRKDAYPTTYRVLTSAWGDDDTGMSLEKNFTEGEKDQAVAYYEQMVRWLSNIALVTMSGLTLIGFERV